MNRTPDRSIQVPRIADLVQRFRSIGETAMRDLPLYNAELEVEAVGFQLLEGHWVGVLITPWFMNLMRLRASIESMHMGLIGQRVNVRLPAGDRELLRGGDELVGAYLGRSLHSPMFAFKDQQAAREEALGQLQALLQPAQEGTPAAEGGRLQLEQEGPQPISRRAFLRGSASPT